MFLKEDENRSPEELEAKKQEHLDKQKRGEGHWEEKLGSQSEANVAADNKTTSAQVSKDGKTTASAAALEEDDEFEDFPVEGLLPIPFLQEQ